MKALARIAVLLVIVALIWLGGLWTFAERVTNSTPAVEPPAADGIVALTGASNVRLEAATQLLDNGKAHRLLISGVNKSATRADVRDVARGLSKEWECCVDLGFHAENTHGNARETAGWVRYHDFRSLIVVTADYHMPRAMLELKAAMPGIQLYAYPVVTDFNAHRWLKDQITARRMVLEYSKFLVILGRSLVSGLTHRAGMDDRLQAPAPTTSGSPG
jgi:uncharacterized SAM-binding protein YcdF (DUF218 family)